MAQGKYQSVQEYYDSYKNMVKVNEEPGSKIGRDKGLLEIISQENSKTVDKLTDPEKIAFSDEGKERYLAIRMLMASDRNRFGGLIEDLRNDYLTGSNEYPKTMGTCFTLLNHWAKNPRNVPGALTPNNVGMAFAHEGDADEGDAQLTVDGNCPKCGRNNHTLAKCRAKYHHDGTVLLHDTCESSYDDSQDELVCVHDGLVFNMTGIEDEVKRNSSPRIPKTWLLLDSQSTIDLACNPDLLVDIHEVEQCLTIRCNAGRKTTKWRGTMPGYGEMWLYREGIANILSLSRVKDKFRVTFDSALDNAFHVHKPEKTIVFQEAIRRLYYFDTAERE